MRFAHRIVVPPRPLLIYCPTCALSTRPVDATCGRCGRPYA